jgi:hypothetical protein
MLLSWIDVACVRDGGFVDHFLLHCDVASALCSALFSRFGMSLGYRLVCVLVVLWKAEQCCGVENGAHLPILDSMEGDEQ